MQVDRHQIESALPQKGFVKEETHHRYFYHEYKGKRTGAYTYTSRGSSYKTYGVALLKRMRTELRLDTIAQAAELFNCPMSGEGYNSILRSKNLIFEPQAPKRKRAGKP